MHLHFIAFALAVLGAGTGAAQPVQAPPGAQQGAPNEQGRLTLSANPARICHDSSRPSYPNFDLIVRNGTDAELEIEEIRAMVLNSADEVVERRLIWQQSLAQLSPDRVVPARGEALIFNPLLFRSAGPGSRIRHEVKFGGGSSSASPVSVTISPEDCTNRPRFVLPITGRVLVYDGYDFHSHHRRTGYGGPDDAKAGITDNFQRYGIDLVVVDAKGRFYRGDGTRTDQWLGWGQPVRAAGAGKVAAVHDGQPDNVAIGTVDRWIDRDLSRNPMSSYGNYVLIDHGGGEFTLVAHLRQGSVAVRRGDRVAAAQIIGRVGNSGASGGVHVHFERRTGPGIAGIQTLPPNFHDLFLVGDERAVTRRGKPIAINSGDIVSAR